MTTISKLPQLATKANEAHQQFERLAGEALDHAQRAGQALTEAKAALPHGQFETWIQCNVKFSSRTARTYMRLAANWQVIIEKRFDCPKLSLRDAIELLTTPQNEDAQNGNALPFCLPTAGEMLIGLISHDGGLIVIESLPGNERFIRIAVFVGHEIEFTRRGINRDLAGWTFNHMGVSPDSIEWLSVMAATVQNNPHAGVP